MKWDGMEDGIKYLNLHCLHRLSVDVMNECFVEQPWSELGRHWVLRPLTAWTQIRCYYVYERLYIELNLNIK